VGASDRRYSLLTHNGTDACSSPDDVDDVFTLDDLEDWEDCTHKITEFLASAVEKFGPAPAFAVEAMFSELGSSLASVVPCAAVGDDEFELAETRTGGAHRPEQLERLTRSPEFTAVAAACSRWADTNNGRRRREMLGQVKTPATIVESELRDMVAENLAATSVDVTGSSACGLDMLQMNVDVKAFQTGQSGAIYRCPCEAVLGLSHHVLAVEYGVVTKGRNAGMLSVKSITFYPSWHTADVVASSLAEELRRQVEDGSITSFDAAAQLAETGLLGPGGVCSRLLAALEGLEPIATGTLTLSPVRPSWRVRYPKWPGAKSTALKVSTPHDDAEVKRRRRRRLRAAAG
jgi:hypothetical protein